MARFILGDPSLVGIGGRQHRYLTALAAALRERGHEVLMLGNRAIEPELAARTGALLVITHRCDARPVPHGLDPASAAGGEHVRAEHERVLRADLEEADRRIPGGFRRGDVLFLSGLRHWGLRGLVRWAEALGPGRAPRVSLVLRFTAFPRPGDTGGAFAMYGDAFRAFAASPLRGRFALFADSEELVAEYAEHGGPEVRLAPVPRVQRAAPRQPGIPGRDRPVTIAYAGEARRDKGFHLLPHLAAGLVRQGLEDRATLHIQSFTGDPQDSFYTRAMRRLVQPNILFFPKALSEEDYSAFLSAADVILVPYSQDNYHRQTSSVFAEAVAAGTPSVVPRGTWMARQARRLGGARLFVPDDPQSLLETTLDAIRDYPGLVEEARRAAEAWNGFHRADVLAALVASAARLPA